MKKFILFSVVTLATNFANAYELSGSMSKDGDNSYSVVLQNENGHEYAGEATKNGDGTLDVSVEDDNDQSYSGTATENSAGSYDLSLQNDSSGGDADGTLTLNN